MIKKLQRQFVLIAMSCVLAIIILLVGAINIVNYVAMRKNIDIALSVISEFGGRFPELRPDGAGEYFPAESMGGESEQQAQAQNPDERKRFPAGHFDAESPYKMRYFSAGVNQDGEITYTNIKSIAAVTEESARQYASRVIESGKTSGADGVYRFLVSNSDSGKTIVFLDCSAEQSAAYSLLMTSLTIAGLAFASIFVLVALFSKRAIKPYAENLEKQKRFITDASHEIKTPLAIISANADVLEMDGKNEWTDSIKKQTARLGKLVKNLVTLARMDEGDAGVVFADFSISDAVADAAAPFVSLAKSQGKNFSLNAEPDIIYNGDEESIRLLVSILCDNAVKYTDGGGKIELTLAKKGKEILLSVYNTCSQIDRKELPKLFDRFYRADASRDRQTGGYGIGLSIAKAIVTSHSGKINAKTTDEKSVVFTALL